MITLSVCEMILDIFLRHKKISNINVQYNSNLGPLFLEATAQRILRHNFFLFNLTIGRKYPKSLRLIRRYEKLTSKPICNYSAINVTTNYSCLDLVTFLIKNNVIGRLNKKNEYFSFLTQSKYFIIMQKKISFGLCFVFL